MTEKKEETNDSAKDKTEENTKEVKEESKEETKTEEKPKEEKSKEQTKTEKTESKPKEETKETKKQEKPKEKQKTAKKEEKPSKKTESKQKKEKNKDDFKYIVRLANTDVDGGKKLIFGLTSIKGIGIHLATLIADDTGINRNTKIGDLTDKQVEKLQNSIDDIKDLAPNWMLNHRKDMEAGEDIHLVGPEIDMKLRDEINIMRKIRSYKGIRHERGLRVRGQRTRGNNRTGLTLGVSKKSVQQKQK